ncbi:MAG TPA: outer membrane protein assembly factor BamA [Alphaproteobacteria bacterium]|nr:outer membrane protein assembly factor BamA [Alphaproteobacteria bacterium]
MAALPVCALSPPQQAGQIIESIELNGNHRVPKETVMSRIYTKAGDIYDEAALQRDLHSVWNSGYFEDVRIEREESPKGWIIHIYVREKPNIRAIEYHGLNSVSVSDVQERFKKAKVGLSVESPYDPTKAIKARVVLQQLLSEHGRQFATIAVTVQPLPPSSVAVNFNIKEGPKVKVGKIRFQGNKHVPSRALRASMKNLKPIGIPQSIFMENLFSRTFDASKLEEDTERVRDAFQQRGYFKALVQDPKTQLRDTGGGFHIPVLHKSGGKAMDITIPVEEGDRFRLKSIIFKNNKAISNTNLLRQQFPIKDGDIINTRLIGKGLDNLRKAYGEIGFINFSAVPQFEIDDEKKQISMTVDTEEGKTYSVRRIEFQGNTTTRDRVIRREILLQEGQPFNSKYWELSILRLNQLNYFQAIKPEEDTERKLNEQDSSVDLLVKVVEKGKNSIGINGGLSGLSGSFIGLNYETNNFLGLCETLTVQASVGNLSQNITFGFTEPYMFDRPLQLGFTVFSRKYDFNQVRQAQIISGQQVNLPQSILNNLTNYNQSSVGFTTSLGYSLRSFKHLGLTYSYDRTNINTFSTASTNTFQLLNFRNISGPDATKGIITSSVTPSFGFNKIAGGFRATSGKSLFIATEVAGLGGNVNFYRPVAAYTQLFPIRPKQTLAMRLQASFISGYGGKEAPPFQRSYLGGEGDLRGFDIRTASPYVFISTVQPIALTNPDGSQVPIDPANRFRGPVRIPIPINNITLPGGDTSVVANLEYRVHVFGPVNLVPFVDTGMSFAARASQLRINSDSLTQLNTTLYGCTALVNFQCTGGTQLNFPGELKPVGGTNYVPRMSTGLELQVLLPIVQQPFRIYYAYNPLILDKLVSSGSQITRGMFPPGGAGDFTFQTALSALAPDFRLKEPRKTFKFTISTTF